MGMAGALISMSVGMLMLVATCIPALILLVLSNVAAPMDGLLFQELTTVNALTSMNVSMKTSTTAMLMLSVTILTVVMNVNAAMVSLVMVLMETVLLISLRLLMNALKVPMIVT